MYDLNNKLLNCKKSDIKSLLNGNIKKKNVMPYQRQDAKN